MAGLSKTARASLRVGTMDGAVKRTAVSWVFKSRPGSMQTKPYLTFFREGEGEAFMSAHTEGFFLVKWLENRKR